MRHILKHSGRYVYRHEDLIAIAGECGGQILSLFEFWTSCRMAEQDRVRSQNKQLAAKGKSPTKEPDNWLLETIEDIRAGLMDGWGISSIKRALKQLVEAGYILEGKAKNPWLRTKTYQLNIPEVQKALDAWQNGQSGVLVEAQNPVVLEQLNSTYRGVDFNSSSGCFESQTIYNNNPSKHSQPMGQQSQGVCGEEEGKDKSPFVQPPTSGVTSTRNDPEKSSTLGAAAVLSAKWDSVESLIESILVDPYLDPTEPIPSVIKSEMKSRRWLFPWRSLTRHNLYQTCDQVLVDHIAKEWASWNNEPTYKQKIPGVIGWIGENERTKTGLEKIMSYWSIVNKEAQKDDPAVPKAQPDQQPKVKAKDPNLDPDILLDGEWRCAETNRRMRKTDKGDIVALMETGKDTWTWVVIERAKPAPLPACTEGRKRFQESKARVQLLAAQQNLDSKF